MSATEIRPVVKATDMDSDELAKVVELVDLAFK